jgi:hypothetical protein
MAGSNRAVSIAGGFFVVAFAGGLVFLADELGAFADHDGTFVDHFSTGSQRGADIAGSILLAAAAVTFMYFAHLIASIRPDSDNKAATSDLVRMAGILTGVFMLVAALALVTVPLSISLGEFFDEAGGAFGQGQAVLPQFGFVALVFGAMIPAAVTMVAVARLGLFPTWLARASIPVAVLLALTSGSVMTMVLLPIWVGLATVALAKAHRQENG